VVATSRWSCTLKLEICVDSVDSAIAAQEGGADRVELCADLDHDGTTPDAGLIGSVRERISIGLFVMIRPRPGNFCYSDHEFGVMQRDIEIAKRLGADGVVLGMLTKDGDVDVPRCKALLELARPSSATFHRAFDECRNLHQAIDDLKAMGIDRVLTSGGRGDIGRNSIVIADLVRSARGSLEIMAGGGVRFENVTGLIRETGVREIHALSAVSNIVGHSTRGAGLTNSSKRLVDVQRVRSLVQLLRDSSPDAH